MNYIDLGYNSGENTTTESGLHQRPYEKHNTVSVRTIASAAVWILFQICLIHLKKHLHVSVVRMEYVKEASNTGLQ